MAKATGDSFQSLPDGMKLLYETNRSSFLKSERLRIVRDKDNKVHAQFLTTAFFRREPEIKADRIFTKFDEDTLHKKESAIADQFKTLKGDIGDFLKRIEFELSLPSSPAARPTQPIAETSIPLPPPPKPPTAETLQQSFATLQQRAREAAAQEVEQRKKAMAELQSSLTSLKSDVDAAEAAFAAQGFSKLHDTFDRIKSAADSVLQDLNTKASDPALSEQTVKQSKEKVSASRIGWEAQIALGREILIQAPEWEKEALSLIAEIENFPPEFLQNWRPKIEAWKKSKGDVDTLAGVLERQKNIGRLFGQICQEYKIHLNDSILTAKTQLSTFAFEHEGTGKEVRQAMKEMREDAWGELQRNAVKIDITRLKKTVIDLQNYAKEIKAGKTLDDTLLETFSNSLFETPIVSAAPLTPQPFPKQATFDNGVAFYVKQLLAQIGPVTGIAEDQPLSLSQLEAFIKETEGKNPAQAAQMTALKKGIETLLACQKKHRSGLLALFETYRFEQPETATQKAANAYIPKVQPNSSATNTSDLKALKSTWQQWRTEAESILTILQEAPKIVALQKQFQSKIPSLEEQLVSLTGIEKKNATEALSDLKRELIADSLENVDIKTYQETLEKHLKIFTEAKEKQERKIHLHQTIAKDLESAVSTIKTHQQHIEEIEQNKNLKFDALKTQLATSLERLEGWKTQGPLPTGNWIADLTLARLFLGAFPEKMVQTLNVDELELYSKHVKDLIQTELTSVNPPKDSDNPGKAVHNIDTLYHQFLAYKYQLEATKEKITLYKEQSVSTKSEQSELTEKSEKKELLAKAEGSLAKALHLESRQHQIEKDQEKALKGNTSLPYIEDRLKKDAASLTSEMAKIDDETFKLEPIVQLQDLELEDDPGNKERMDELRKLVLEDILDLYQTAKDEITTKIESFKEKYPSISNSIAQIKKKLEKELERYAEADNDNNYIFTADFPISWFQRKISGKGIILNEMNCIQLLVFKSHVKNIINKFQNEIDVLLEAKEQAETAEKKWESIQKDCRLKISALKKPGVDQFLLADQLQQTLDYLKYDSDQHFEKLKKTSKTKFHKLPYFDSLPYFDNHKKKLGEFIAKMEAEFRRVVQIAKFPPSLGRQLSLMQEKIDRDWRLIAATRARLKSLTVDSQLGRSIQKAAGIRDVLALAPTQYAIRAEEFISNKLIDYLADPLLHYGAITATAPFKYCWKKIKNNASSDYQHIWYTPAEAYQSHTDKFKRYAELKIAIRERYKEKLEVWKNQRDADRKNFKAKLSETLSLYVPKGSTLYGNISKAIDSEFNNINDNVVQKFKASFAWTSKEIDALSPREIEDHENTLKRVKDEYPEKLEKQFSFNSILAAHDELEKQLKIAKDYKLPNFHHAYLLQHAVDTIEEDRTNHWKERVSTASRLPQLALELKKHSIKLAKAIAEATSSVSQEPKQKQLETLLSLKKERPKERLLADKIDLATKALQHDLQTKLSGEDVTITEYEEAFKEASLTFPYANIYFQLPLNEYKKELARAKEGISLDMSRFWKLIFASSIAYEKLTPQETIEAHNSIDSLKSKLANKYLYPYGLPGLKTQYTLYKNTLELTKNLLEKKKLENRPDAVQALTKIIHEVEHKLKNLSFSSVWFERFGRTPDPATIKKNHTKLAEELEIATAKLTAANSAWEFTSIPLYKVIDELEEPYRIKALQILAEEVPAKNLKQRQKLDAYKMLNATYAEIAFPDSLQNKINAKIDVLLSKLDELIKGSGAWFRGVTPLHQLSAKDLKPRLKAIDDLEKEIEKFETEHHFTWLQESHTKYKEAVIAAQDKIQHWQTWNQTQKVITLQEALKAAKHPIKFTDDKTITSQTGVKEIADQLANAADTLHNTIRIVSSEGLIAPEEQFKELFNKAIAILGIKKRPDSWEVLISHYLNRNTSNPAIKDLLAMYNKIRTDIATRLENDVKKCKDAIQNFQKTNLDSLEKMYKALNGTEEPLPRAWRLSIEGEFTKTINELNAVVAKPLGDLSHVELLEFYKKARTQHLGDEGKEAEASPAYDNLRKLTRLESFEKTFKKFEKIHLSIKNISHRTDKQPYKNLQAMHLCHLDLVLHSLSNLYGKSSTQDCINLITESTKLLKASSKLFEENKDVPVDPWTQLSLLKSLRVRGMNEIDYRQGTFPFDKARGLIIDGKFQRNLPPNVSGSQPWDPSPFRTNNSIKENLVKVVEWFKRQHQFSNILSEKIDDAITKLERTIARSKQEIDKKTETSKAIQPKLNKIQNDLLIIGQTLDGIGSNQARIAEINDLKNRKDGLLSQKTDLEEEKILYPIEIKNAQKEIDQANEKIKLYNKIRSKYENSRVELQKILTKGIHVFLWLQGDAKPLDGIPQSVPPDKDAHVLAEGLITNLFNLKTENDYVNQVHKELAAENNAPSDTQITARANARAPGRGEGKRYSKGNIQNLETCIEIMNYRDTVESTWNLFKEKFVKFYCDKINSDQDPEIQKILNETVLLPDFFISLAWEISPETVAQPIDPSYPSASAAHARENVHDDVKRPEQQSRSQTERPAARSPNVATGNPPRRGASIEIEDEPSAAATPGSRAGGGAAAVPPRAPTSVAGELMDAARRNNLEPPDPNPYNAPAPPTTSVAPRREAVDEKTDRKRPEPAPRQPPPATTATTAAAASAEPPPPPPTKEEIDQLD